MLKLTRVTGFAVAFFLIAANAVYVGPSWAWEVDPATQQPTSFLDHGTAAPAELAAAPGELSAPTYDPNLTAEIVEHAVAPLPEADWERRSLTELVEAYASRDVPDSELECLAGAVYFESKGEPLQGQLAVAEVILNRASSGRFPSSICGVVKQKSQFSFVRGGRIPPISRDSAAWRRAVAIAHIAKAELGEAGVGEAMFFHARYVSPNWRRLKRVASIGNHIFYR